MAAKRMRYVALALGAAWACWWVFFETAEAMGDGPFTQAILFGAVVLAWKWPALGAAAFFAEALAALALFTPAWARNFRLGSFLLLFAMMPLPPLAAGILLLLSRRQARSHEHVAA